MESTAEVVMVSQMAELRHPICDTVDDKIAGYLHYHCSAYIAMHALTHLHLIESPDSRNSRYLGMYASREAHCA